MKKFLSLILALCMVLCMTAFAAAEEVPDRADGQSRVVGDVRQCDVARAALVQGTEDRLSDGHSALVRIHDLRHTFICRRLIAWQKEGVPTDNAMLALSTYVGHASVADTYWYIEGIPDLMALAGARFEAAVDPEGGSNG